MWNNSWTLQYRSLGELPDEIFHRSEDKRDPHVAEYVGLALLAAKRKLPGASLSEVHDAFLGR